MDKRTPAACITRRRFVALVVTTLSGLLAISCALGGAPTPVALPTASATTERAQAATSTASPEPPAATGTATVAPATQTPTPTHTPTAQVPTDTPSPTATQKPPSPTPTPLRERISFAPGATYAAIEGDLAAGETRRYVLGISGDQLVEVSASSGQPLRFGIIGADGAVVKVDGQPFFRGVVPATQDYVLTLTNDGDAAAFTLGIRIPVRITFEPGATSTQLSASQPANTSRVYVIRALKGQTMTLDAAASVGEVILIVYGVDGTVLQTDHAGSSTFTGVLPITQDYLISVRAVGGQAAGYTLDVTIPPPVTPTPTPTVAPATRISFGTGATTASLEGLLPALGAHLYVLGVGQGQLMEVSVSPSGGILLSIVGADGQVVMSPGEPFFRGVVPKTQDYVIRIEAGSQAANYSLNVMIPVRITFAPGATTAERQASLAPYATGHFVIRALAGQTMTLETTATSGEVILIVYGADGMVLQTDHAGSSSFTGVLPSSQDYLINIRSVGATTADITLSVAIPPP